MNLGSAASFKQSMSFPIKHWDGNLLFDGNGRVFAVYSMPLSNYSYLTLEQQRAELWRLSRLFYSIQASGSLISLSKELSTDAVLKGMEDIRFTEQFGQLFRQHQQATAQKLLNRRAWTRELFLVLQLPPIRHGGWKTQIGDFVRGLQDPFGNEGTFPQWMVDQALVYEARYAQEVFTTLRGDRATESEVLWLLTKPWWRGMGEPPMPNWKPSIVMEFRGADIRLRPIESEMLALFDDLLIEERFNKLEIQHADGAKAYQTFLAISQTPESISFPGSEYLFSLEQLGFPLDVVVQFEVQAPSAAMSRVGNKMMEIRDERQEHYMAEGSAPFEIEQGEMVARGLQHSLSKGMPLLYTTTVLSLSAAEPEIIEHRVQAVRSLMKPQRFSVARPPGDMWRAFQTFLPGNSIWKTYQIPMDPEYVSGSMLHGTHTVGDTKGFYIGWNQEGAEAPIFIDPALPPQRNKTAAVANLGSLGGGKSTLTKLLITMVMMLGGTVVIIDPKDEYRSFQSVPEIRDVMEQIDLSASSYGTRFNPFSLSEDAQFTTGLVTDLLFIMTRAQGMTTDHRQIAIHRVVELCMRRKNPTLHTAIDAFTYLATNESVRDVQQAVRDEALSCASLLDAYRRMPIGSILFGERPLKTDDSKKLVNFNFADLVLPKNLGTELTMLSQQELLSIAVLYTVTSFARHFVLRKYEQDKEKAKGMFSALVVDEAWMLMQNREGSKLIKDVIRMGRTYNVMPIISTQSSSDLLDETVKNNIGQFFVFRNTDETEIKNSLKLLGLDPENPTLREQMGSFQSGQCFYKDSDGRVGMVQIEPLPSFLLEQFSTTPPRPTHQSS